MYTVGEVINGVVDGIAEFGAFVELEDGRTGLIHISEIADEYVEQVDDYLGDGEEIEVRVNRDQGEKIDLTLENNPNSRRQNFEHQLQRYLEEAEKSRQDYTAWARQNLEENEETP